MSPFSKQRPSRRKRLRLASPGGVLSNPQAGAQFVHAAGQSGLPGLSMPEPADRRGLLVSSAVSALLHVLVIGGIALVGYLAKQVVEEIIPVTLLNKPIELPGSNEPARLPVPKMLSSPIATAVPLAMDPAVLAAVPAPMIQAPQLDTTAPKTLDLAQLTSAALATSADMSPTPSAADISDVQPLDISAADLVAPKVEISGPTATAERTATDLAAPKAFENLSNIDAAQYKGAVTAVPTVSDGIEAGGEVVATGVAAEYLAPGFAGGDPNAMGTVPCLESAYVSRYIDLIDERTTNRFEVPLSSGPEDFVKVRIALDHSGSIVRLELIDSTHPQFAENAMKALKSASPFPPLNDNNRCLTEKSFLMTFNYPE